MNINKLAKEIHEQNVKKGWWDGEQCIYTKLQLVSTEIAEATEAERRDLMDSKLKHRKGGEVELADAMIRVLDLGGKFYWKYYGDYDSAATLINMSHIDSLSVQEHHLWINEDLIKLADVVTRWGSNQSDVINSEYTFLINGIIYTSKIAGYDIWGAVDEKLEYNKKRKDHERSERAKPGGKKF